MMNNEGKKNWLFEILYTYSGQKKKLSTPKQIQDFPNMIKIIQWCKKIGPTLIGKNYFACFGVESFFFWGTVLLIFIFSCSWRHPHSTRHRLQECQQTEAREQHTRVVAMSTSQNKKQAMTATEISFQKINFKSREYWERNIEREILIEMKTF